MVVGSGWGVGGGGEWKEGGDRGSSPGLLT